MFHLLLLMLSLAGVALSVLTVSTGAYGLADASLRTTLTLPSSTAAVASASGIDVGAPSQNGLLPADVFDLVLTAPALTTAQLPDAKTMTYAVVVSANADMSSPTTLLPQAIVQTGAGGAGAAAATARFKLPGRLPGTGSRYIGITATPSASGAGNASSASATLAAVF